MAAILSVVLLTACSGRTGPPAPVVDRSGIYYTSPAKPSARVKETRLDPPGVRPAKRPARARNTKPAAGTLTARPASRVTVRRGETLYAISRREKVPIRALIDANRLTPPYDLRAEQKLRVPAMRIYIVAPGDTAYAVAQRHGTSLYRMIRENHLKPPTYGLYSGQRLVLPWQAKKKILNLPLPRASRRAEIGAPRTVKTPRVKLRGPSATPPKRAGRKFQWPVQGKILSKFGSKGRGLYNDGINIAAQPGKIVRAAENGIVAYAGNELRGYGNLLLVRHSGGWITAYAHNGKLMVRRGQVVKRGQPIARIGQSGAVSRPQLHFELRRGRKAVDPRRYLAS